MIVAIDYGAGNLRSVANAFEAIGHKPLVTTCSADLEKASAIVLPGVGVFGDSMKNLRKLNIIDTLNEQILVKKKPFLGICVGMQILGMEGQEYGTHEGLGWIKGTVKKVEPEGNKYRIPHMGWNEVQIERPCTLFEDMEGEPVFYFLHSYHLVVDDAEKETVTTTCWHGTTVTASVQKDNIFAVQFHPEKSQQNGLKLLESFVKFT